MQDLGYETESALFALGTVFLLTCVYLARVIFYIFILTPYNWYKFDKYKAYKKKLADSIFFGEFL